MAEVKNRRVSNTNMVEKVPSARKATAMVSGADGAALAVTMISEIESIAKAIDMERKSRKDHLAAIMKLDKPGLVAFHAAMMARADAVRTAMEEMKLTDPSIKGLREYFEVEMGSQTVYVQCSMWKTIGLAIDAGWQPDLTQPWDMIKSKAAERVASIGKPSADPSKPEPARSSQTRRRGAVSKPVEQKAANAAVGMLKDADNKPLPKNNRNLGLLIAGILDADGGATLEELNEVAAVVQKRLEAALAAKEAMEKAKAAPAKAAPTPTGEGTKVTTGGATVKVTKHRKAAPASTADALIDAGKAIVNAEKEEKAEARNTRRTK